MQLQRMERKQREKQREEDRYKQRADPGGDLKGDGDLPPLALFLKPAPCTDTTNSNPAAPPREGGEARGCRAAQKGQKEAGAEAERG